MPATKTALDGDKKDDVDIRDEKHLAVLGYKQELKRQMTYYGSVGTTLGCSQPLLCAGVFYFAFGFGGPVSVIWGFIGALLGCGCFVWCFFLALSLAEISSQYTVAGGPYYWAGALSGKLGRFPAYLQGWVMYLTFVAGITSYEFQIAQQLTSIKLILDNSKLGTPPGALGDVSGVAFGVAVPNVENATFQNGIYGIMIGFTCFHALANLLPVKHMNKVAIASFSWLIMISSLIMFALPAITPKRNDGKFIFAEWIGATTRPELGSSSSTDTTSMTPPSPALSLHATGIASNGWTAMTGLLMGQYLMLVWDTPAHMAEETKDAARVVPKAIMTSYVLGGMLNIGLLISYLACLNLEHYQYSGDYDENFGVPLETPDNRVAAGNFLYLGVTNGLFPIGNIFYDSFMARYGRAEGAAAFTFFIFMATNFTGVLTFTCATRFFYSFARDGGFPIFNKQLAYVEPRTGIPVNCVALMLVSVICLSTAILTENWFSKINAVCSTISNGFLFTYGVPPLLRLLNSGSFAPHENFNLGRFSKPCAIIGAGYAFFSVATIALPGFMPATEETLNYAPVALGAVIMFAVVTYPVVGPWLNAYKGPALAHLEDETTWKGNQSGMGLSFGAVATKPAAPEPAALAEGMEDSARGSAS